MYILRGFVKIKNRLPPNPFPSSRKYHSENFTKKFLKPLKLEGKWKPGEKKRTNNGLGKVLTRALPGELQDRCGNMPSTLENPFPFAPLQLICFIFP